jgi:hypothetical protein
MHPYGGNSDYTAASTSSTLSAAPPWLLVPITKRRPHRLSLEQAGATEMIDTRVCMCIVFIL